MRFKLKHLDEALTFMNLSLEQSLETDDVISQACSYRGLGEIYSALGRYGIIQHTFQTSYRTFRKCWRI